jgi:hypothetical protein
MNLASSPHFCRAGMFSSTVALLLLGFTQLVVSQTPPVSSQYQWVYGPNATDIASTPTSLNSRAGTRPVTHPLNTSLLVFYSGQTAATAVIDNIYTWDISKSPASQFRYVEGTNLTDTNNTASRPAPRTRHCTETWSAANSIVAYGGQTAYGSRNDMYVFAVLYRSTCIVLTFPFFPPCFPSSTHSWQYNFGTASWVWLGGANVSGTQTNMPGSRDVTTCWISPTKPNVLYIFGGWGFPASWGGADAQVNDLWQFDLTTKTFQYLAGHNTTQKNGTINGVPSMPGARISAIHFKIASLPTKLFVGCKCCCALNKNVVLLLTVSYSYSWRRPYSDINCRRCDL